jgi:hypothetical protein
LPGGVADGNIGSFDARPVRKDDDGGIGAGHASMLP